jgi:NitT/TauT family transport system substrate-binding protein
MTRSRSLLLPLATLALFTAACSSSSTSGQTQPSSTSAPAVDTTPPVATLPADLVVSADAPFPADRCAANKAAGKILYLSSFDYAASASIVDVLVANAKGYYADLCLDVELKPSFSTENYPLIAANQAQFSSGGSFSEVVDFAGRNDAGFVTLSVEGRTGIDALIVKQGLATTLDDLRGTTIGVKGAITPSVKAMLAKAGLVEGTDYQTVLLDGFDPKVHIEIPGIVGFPGYKSNEPKQLEAAGIPFTLFDPSSYDIPGSFGIIYSNETFLKKFPTAAADFMRATMRGLADAIADPKAAAQIAVDAINANGNAMFLSPEGETARWGVESQLVSSLSSPTAPAGVPQVAQLENEVSTYASIGLFDGVVPDISTLVDTTMVASLYDATGALIWPKQ